MAAHCYLGKSPRHRPSRNCSLAGRTQSNGGHRADNGPWGDSKNGIMIQGMSGETGKRPTLAEDPICVINCSNNSEIYSFHPGGANFLFGDCSVKFIAEDVDYRVILAHASRHGGELFTAEDY